MSGPPPTAIDAATARWKLELRAGDRVAFALQYATSSQRRPEPGQHEEIERSLTGTHEGWRSWRGSTPQASRHDADEAVTARMVPFVERRYVCTGNGVFVCKRTSGNSR
ncbi:MAG: hypothetical protein ACRDST_10750 [Pseudonocardiaceae bacterium]